MLRPIVSLSVYTLEAVRVINVLLNGGIVRCPLVQFRKVSVESKADASELAPIAKKTHGSYHSR
jgi:hypothetical protein